MNADYADMITIINCHSSIYALGIVNAKAFFPPKFKV